MGANGPKEEGDQETTNDWPDNKWKQEAPNDKYCLPLQEEEVKNIRSICIKHVTIGILKN